MLCRRNHGKSATDRETLKLRHSFGVIGHNKWNAFCYTIELVLMMIHVTKRDGSLESAESMVSNNKTIGYSPHETG